MGLQLTKSSWMTMVFDHSESLSKQWTRNVIAYLFLLIPFFILFFGFSLEVLT